MGSKGRWEYLQAIYERYRRAGRKAKKVILDELCENTGYHRKYAIRLLNGPPPEKRRRRPVRRRGQSYRQESVAVLTAVWEAAGYPWSVRLKALLPLWLPWIRRRSRQRPEIEKQFAAPRAAPPRGTGGPPAAPTSVSRLLRDTRRNCLCPLALASPAPQLLRAQRLPAVLNGDVPVPSFPYPHLTLRRSIVAALRLELEIA